MEHHIIDNEDEKVIETFTRMTDRNDLNEFKDAFKRKYDKDWEKIVKELKDEESDSNVGAPEKYLEELFGYHRDKIDS